MQGTKPTESIILLRTQWSLGIIDSSSVTFMLPWG